MGQRAIPAFAGMTVKSRAFLAVRLSSKQVEALRYLSTSTSLMSNITASFGPIGEPGPPP
jgi:hypothetical protein